MIFTGLLVAHICLAGLALCAGNVALLAPKTHPAHRVSGRIFVKSMLSMVTVALILAIMHTDLISIVPAMLSFYLVATGWRTMTRRHGGLEPIDLILILLALVASITGFILGWNAAHGVNGVDKDGFPPTPYYIFATIAVLGASLDVRLFVWQALGRAHRLARHLWRMCFALLITTTSFFQGQEQVFPKPLQGSLLLKMPALLVFAVASFWALRLLLGRLPGARRAIPARPVSDGLPMPVPADAREVGLS